MANKKISQLTQLSTLNAGNFIPIVSGSGTYKTTLSTLDNFLSDLTNSGNFEDIKTNSLIVSGTSNFAGNSVFSGNLNIRGGLNITGNLNVTGSGVFKNNLTISGANLETNGTGFINKIIVGSQHTSTGNYSSILGGTGHLNNGTFSMVGGGIGNQVNGNYSSVLGGINNFISNSDFCSIIGNHNSITVNSQNCFHIGSGNSSTDAVTNGFAFGVGNDVINSYCIAIGSHIETSHSGAVIIADAREVVNKTSVTTNTCNFHFQNGVFVSGSNFEIEKTGTFKSNVDIFGLTRLSGNLEVSGSGLFYGNLNVSGSGFYNKGVFVTGGNLEVNNTGFIKKIIIGSEHISTGSFSSILGGTGNLNNGSYSFIGAGIKNQTDSHYVVILGSRNLISSNSNFSFTIGDSNSIGSSSVNCFHIGSGNNSTDGVTEAFSLGIGNDVINPYCIAVGHYIETSHSGATIFADARNVVNKTSITTNSCNFNYQNGVFISGSNLEVEKTGIFKSSLNTLGKINPYGGISGYLQSGEIPLNVLISGQSGLLSQLGVTSVANISGSLRPYGGISGYAASGQNSVFLNTTINSTGYINNIQSSGIQVLTGNADFTGATTIIRSNPPASSGAAGSKGTITFDSDYIYVCINTNTWRRVGLTGVIW